MKIFITSFLVLMTLTSMSQNGQNYQFEPSQTHPFGQINPEAPEQLKDFSPMIGECDCTSERRISQTEWSEPEAVLWRFKYIMNGMGIQDETLKEDGQHSGSIRMYNTDSLRWYVHWYSPNPVASSLPTWEGNKKGDDIILYKNQKSPNGVDGYYRLTFFNIREEGFDWVGEWVDLQETIAYSTWKISCIKRKK